MLKEYRNFAMRGNVIDLAVGIIIGAAFTGVVSSLVDDIIMPPVGMFIDRVDFSQLFISLDGVFYPSLQAAQEAGAATINIGLFINSLITFLITAFAVFLLVRVINRMNLELEDEPDPVVTRECPFCFTKISIQASRCPNCTSDLPPAEESDVAQNSQD